MNRTLRLISLLAASLALSQAHGDVIITEPIGGNDVPADRALNSTNGAAFTNLGDLIITEGSASDFALG